MFIITLFKDQCMAQEGNGRMTGGGVNRLRHARKLYCLFGTLTHPLRMKYLIVSTSVGRGDIKDAHVLISLPYWETYWETKRGATQAMDVQEST